MWVCPRCETRNHESQTECRLCGCRAPFLPPEEEIEKEKKRSSRRIAMIAVFSGILALLLVGILFFWVLPGIGQRSHDQEVAERISDKIHELSVDSLDDKDSVEEVRELYDDLSETQKKYVENYSDLKDAEEKLEDLKAEAVIYYVNHVSLTGDGVYLRKEAKEDSLSTGMVSRGDDTKILRDLKNDTKDSDGTTWHYVQMLKTGGEEGPVGYVKASDVQYATEEEVARVLGTQ